MSVIAAALLVGVAILPLSSTWASPPTPWTRVESPTLGPMQAIGGYSGGCIQGAAPLPLDGPGYQVMRPGRLRYFGHSDLLDFISTLGSAVQKQSLGPLLIGDLSQPRGGRTTGGHASHQSGLDVDIWFWHPKRALKGPLPRKQRERIAARSILGKDKTCMRRAWKAKATTTLRLAASDARVARIFVNPAIKRELCQDVTGNRDWLRKIRPWHGHEDHFHVRLACPIDSPQCTPQAAIAPGDGCQTLGFWFDTAAQEKRRKAKKRYQRKVDSGPRWPEACTPLLTMKAGSNLNTK